MPPPTVDLTGKKFGDLTVIAWEGYLKRGRQRFSWWLCDCSCGTQRKFEASQLKRGKTKSCGCVGRAKARELAKRLSRSKAENEGPIAARQLYSRYKNDARRMSRDFEITFDDAMSLFHGNCTYCGLEPHRINRSRDSYFAYNGIDRVNNEEGYIAGNCVPCCKKCNEIKRDLTLSEFKELIVRMHKVMCGGEFAIL